MFVILSIDFTQVCEGLYFHVGNAVKPGDVNILFTFYSLKPILNIHTALQINHLSILPDFRLLREEGCSVGNFFLSLQWFTPHRFHFSIFETPQRPHSHEAGCTLKKRSARKDFTNRYRSHRPQRWTPPFLSTAPALLWTRSRLRPCQLILTQFGPVSRSGKGAPWLRGLPRIPQWGALLLHASSFHLSIHLSSLLLLAPPSISQCVVIFVCSYPCQDNIVLLSHVFPTHPPLHFTSLPSRFQPCI